MSDATRRRRAERENLHVTKHCGGVPKRNLSTIRPQLTVFITLDLVGDQKPSISLQKIVLLIILFLFSITFDFEGSFQYFTRTTFRSRMCFASRLPPRPQYVELLALS